MGRERSEVGYEENCCLFHKSKNLTGIYSELFMTQD